jgi:hypothetical protein
MTDNEKDTPAHGGTVNSTSGTQEDGPREPDLLHRVVRAV